MLTVFLLLVITLVLLSGILWHIFDVDLLERLPKTSICPFRLITGLKCPGCGMTRSMLLIGQLRIGRAVEANVFALPLLAIILVHLISGGHFNPPVDRRLLWVILLLAVAYWISRNISEI